ncbi:uncharacterized protein B4U80_02589 [Leptotrombidium deliense]|uniref:Chromo domain-containing protein n=1 Tax=Leptotrombidium deliense TaxID=299467 RepID=A0A443RS44_9ACAR|nr:uncharacterized protein B4U80_02589 [Leptotrombidium deliense]
MKPSEVNYVNQQTVFRNLYGYSSKMEIIGEKIKKQHKVKNGEWVRIPYDSANKFSRGYYPQWKEEVFKVEKPVKKQSTPLYKLKDFEGENIKGTFYEAEVQKVSEPKSFRVEKILERRKRKGKIEYFVKWLGYSEKFNQWIPSTDIVNTAAMS